MISAWPYISFFELSLRDGQLFAHLGSGPANEIIDRQITDPCIRICVQEPSEELVSFRARCGIAELTTDGLKAKPHDDEAEARGAWARLLPIGSHVLATLSDAWQMCPKDKAMQAALKPGWMEINGDAKKEADIVSVRHSLAKAKLANPEKTVFVRFGGTPDEIAQALSLLGENVP